MPCSCGLPPHRRATQGGGHCARPRRSPAIVLVMAVLALTVSAKADTVSPRAPAETPSTTQHTVPTSSLSLKSDSQNASSSMKEDDTRRDDEPGHDSDGDDSSRGPYPRIVNGEDVDITEVPYQAALEFAARYTCGGSVISEMWILTAAHCFERPNQNIAGRWRVRLGTSLRQKGGRLVKVQSIATHPRYTGRGWDVALLRLAERVSFNSACQAVRLSGRGDTDPSPGADMTISGWGATKFESAYLPSNLQRAKVQIIDRNSCSTSYDAMDMSPIRSDEICAGGNKRDSCQGDSGGAMVDSSGVQVGIVSWGEGCATYPGVYTKVGNAEIRDFIRRTSGV